MELPGKLRPLGALCLALALVLAPLGCSESLQTLPTELLGTWKTDSPAHANRFLQLGGGTFVLGVAGLDLDVVAIERIERTRDAEERTLYRLHFHADEGYDDVLLLTMLGDAASPALRIGAQPQVWRPAATR